MANLTEHIQFILSAGAVQVTGLTIQDGQLRLTLSAEVDLQALQEQLQGELSRLADLHHLHTALPEEIPPVASFLPEMNFAAQAMAEEGRVFLPGSAGVPEHYFPEPDDDTLLAEEEEALGFEHDELPPLAIALSGGTVVSPESPAGDGAEPAADVASLFAPDELPVLPPLHYFPEPDEVAEDEPEADELGGYDDLPLVDEDEVNDLLTEDGALLAEDELDFDEDNIPEPEEAAPAEDSQESGWTADAAEEESLASPEEEERQEDAGEHPDRDELAPEEGSAVYRAPAQESCIPLTGSASQPLSVNLEEALSTPEGRYGEPEPDIEWSALLSDQHSELASTTRPADTPVDEAFHPESECLDSAEPEESDDDHDSPSLAPDLDEEPSDADEEEFPEENEDNDTEEPAEDGESEEEPQSGDLADEGQTGEPTVRPGSRRPFTLINPKLHNDGDEPDDTPPGTEANESAKPDSGFVPFGSTLPTAPHGADEAPRPVAPRKTRIKYVCPKCHTPGQQDMDRLGSVVTCANCGRAMRLTMKR